MKNNLLLLVIFILLLFSFLLFHETGNRILKPHIENFLQSKIETNDTLELQEFRLTFNELTALIRYNQTTTLELQGDYSALLKNFDMRYHLISEKFRYKKLTYDEHLDLNGTLQGTFSGDQLNAKGTAQNEWGLLKFYETAYHFKTKKLTSLYTLYLNDLSRLKKLTKQPLQGALTIQGEVTKENDLLEVKGESNDLEGRLSFHLRDDDITLKMEKISVEKVMTMLRYPQIFKASIVGDAHYDTKKRKGVLKSTLLDAQLLPNDFITLIKNFNGLDLSQEKFEKSYFNATLQETFINFEFSAENTTTKIQLSPAQINRKRETIKAHYRVEVKGKDVGGEIKGNIHDPKVTVDSSQYIKREVNNVIDKHSETLKDIGIGEKEQKKVKDFFNSLFK